MELKIQILIFGLVGIKNQLRTHGLSDSWEDTGKSDIFYIWKIKNLKKSNFEKKAFTIFAKHLYLNWRAENMPIVAGRLIIFI